MKNNFRFIFPRLIGATVIVGFAALVITTLFKLLLGAVLIGSMALLAKRLLGRSARFPQQDGYGQFMPGSFGSVSSRYHGVQPNTVSAVPVQQQTTIVPIN